MSNFFKNIFSKPPMLFPLIGGFHVLLLVYTVYTFGSEPFPSQGWIHPLWMVGYTVAWIFCCDMRKWAAYLYLLLTAINITIHLAMPEPDKMMWRSSLFLMDVLFSFFILFYFKRFE